MNYKVLQNRIMNALAATPLQYHNQMRLSFEVWAMKKASTHCVLLEYITRSEGIWNWYKNQYQKTERRFYRENKEFMIGEFDSDNLYDIFIIMTTELETIYPATLINNLKHHGQTVFK